MTAGLGCHSTLSIGNHDFPTDLIVLESQSLDVILGMDWLTKFEGNIDCARKTILLTIPEQKKIKYVSRRTPMKNRVNSLTGVVQEEVPVVQDFPDVFPEELPGMPPDRDIEFLMSYCPAQPQYPRDPIGCPRMIWKRSRSKLRSYWRKDIFAQARHLGEPQFFW